MAEKPPRTILNSEFSNNMRLQILLHKANDILRQSFINEWDLRSESTKWEDSDSNRKDFIKGPGKELYEKSLRIQKECLRSRNITEWDLPLLIPCVKALNANVPYKVFEKLKSIRNKLAHLGEPKINDEKYEEYWKQISLLLLQLDVPQVEIDAVKSAPIEALNEAPHPVNTYFKELKDSGNDAFKKERFEESIDYYTEAICIPGVSNKDLAILYSNRSIAFLKLGDIASAKEDAKGSIHLCPSWWKGYFRLAMSYKANGKYELALKNVIIAQEFHDNPSELYDQINSCKRLFYQQEREEHLDPQYFYRTYEELAEFMPNTTAESLKADCDFGIQYNGATGMCTQGHNYCLGRDAPQDYKEAAKWYGKAAAEENAEGLYNLALMYLDGKGVKCDFKEGIRLLQKAASQPSLVKDELMNGLETANIGVCEAQHSLGLVYDEGTGVPRNYEKAKYWYTCAIKNYFGASANNMAVRHTNGNLDLTIHYWKLGAAMNNVRCMENMVRTYFKMKKFENMQQWYLYALENKSISLKLSPDNFEDHFQEAITQKFKKEDFAQALWREVENGPLSHLIDPEVKAAHDLMQNRLSQHLPMRTQPLSRIDSSTVEAYRKSITLAHREIFKEATSRKNNKLVLTGNIANLQPKPITDLFNLKQIFLDEMRQKNRDHIYKGFVLKLTIIEDAIDKSSETAAIRAVAYDEQKSYQRLFIYNYHKTGNDLQENLGFGSKISIVNPYYRNTRDGSPGIRVDDFNTVFVHTTLKNVKICRYCANENCKLPVPCRTCKRCYYCSKKCLKLDTSELQHHLVCKKRI